MNAILAEMPESDASKVRSLVEYDDEVAGGIMIVEYLAFRELDSVGSVIEYIRNRVDELSDFSVQYVYVVSSKNKLLGVLRLRDLLLSPTNTQISRIMIADPVSVHVTIVTFESLHAFFSGSQLCWTSKSSDSQQRIGWRSEILVIVEECVLTSSRNVKLSRRNRNV